MNLNQVTCWLNRILLKTTIRHENKTGHLRLQILVTTATRKASIINNILVVTILKACIVKLS